MMKFDETGSVNYHGEAVKFYTPTRKTAGRVKKIFRKEPITITWMDNMKPGDIVIDIGANVGMYSFHFKNIFKTILILINAKSFQLKVLMI